MTARQLIAALMRETDGDDAILDLDVELDVDELWDTEKSGTDPVTVDITNAVYDCNRIILEGRPQ